MTDETLRDVLDIESLIARLAIAADAGELDEYLALFTEDAVWELSASAGSGVPASTCSGRAEIKASVEQRRAIGVQGPGAGTTHHITTQSIVVDGDEGEGHVYYQFVGMVDRVPTIRTLGQYRDRYRRTPDGWRLSRRTVLIG